MLIDEVFGEVVDPLEPVGGNGSATASKHRDVEDLELELLVDEVGFSLVVQPLRTWDPAVDQGVEGCPEPLLRRRRWLRGLA